MSFSLAWLVAALTALPPLMPVEEIERGQTGVCWTVFEGHEVERFEFAVKGRMHNFLGPKQHLILVRLQGEKPEFTGVVAGMSGSPCFIDGRLIGAISYSFANFAKEPIAGVTPASAMLDVIQLPEEPTPWRIGAKKGWKDNWDAFREGTAVAQAPQGGEPRPIATPLVLGGVPGRVRRHFTPWLRSMGFEPVAGGTSSGKAKPRALTAGSAVAAVLVRGDVDMAGTGTVTVVDGNHVLAFGHPFNGSGAVSLPMANAEILNTMVSAQRSYKMSATGAVVGEITQDRLTAIAGVLGKTPKMVPVHGEITTPGRTETFFFEVARDIAMTPRMVAIGLSSALEGRVAVGQAGTLRLEAVLTVPGLDPIPVRSVYSAEHNGSMLISAAIDVARALATLWDTPFGAPPDVAISVKAQLDPKPVYEWVEAIHADRPQVRPGESVGISVRLRRSDGPTSLERFEVSIPSEWADQAVEIVAGGVGVAEAVAGRAAGDIKPKNLQEIGRWLTERRPAGHVYVMALRKGAGLQAGVQPMPFLPPSAVAILSGSPTHAPRQIGLAWEIRRPRPGMVGGRAGLKVQVLAY